MSDGSTVGPTDGSTDGPTVTPTIVCVDCGGTAHLLSYPPEEGWSAGDVVAYRCRDCLDRWDLVIPPDDEFEAD